MKGYCVVFDKIKPGSGRRRPVPSYQKYTCQNVSFSKDYRRVVIKSVLVKMCRFQKFYVVIESSVSWNVLGKCQNRSIRTVNVRTVVFEQ